MMTKTLKMPRSTHSQSSLGLGTIEKARIRHQIALGLALKEYKGIELKKMYQESRYRGRSHQEAIDHISSRTYSESFLEGEVAGLFKGTGLESWTEGIRFAFEGTTLKEASTIVNMLYDGIIPSR